MNCDNQRRQIHYAIKFVILQNYSPIFIKSRTSITNLNDKKYRIERLFLFTKFLVIAFSFSLTANRIRIKKNLPQKKRKRKASVHYPYLKNDSSLPNPLIPFSKRIRPRSIFCFQLFSAIIRCLSIGRRIKLNENSRVLD